MRLPFVLFAKNERKGRVRIHLTTGRGKHKYELLPIILASLF